MKNEWKDQEDGELAITKPGEILFNRIVNEVDENDCADYAGCYGAHYITHGEFDIGPDDGQRYGGQGKYHDNDLLGPDIIVDPIISDSGNSS
jgi:hypothetical protein